jgi:hypothetical protein
MLQCSVILQEPFKTTVKRELLAQFVTKQFVAKQFVTKQFVTKQLGKGAVCIQQCQIYV